MAIKFMPMYVIYDWNSALHSDIGLLVQSCTGAQG